MGTSFWVRRFVTVALGALVIIAVAQLLKGNTLTYSLTHAGVWALVTAAVFTAARIYQSRRGQHCAVCRDTPEMRAGQTEQP